MVNFHKENKMKNLEKIIRKEYEIYKERYQNYLDEPNSFTRKMQMESTRILQLLFAIQEDIDLYDKDFNDFAFEMNFARFSAKLFCEFKDK